MVLGALMIGAGFVQVAAQRQNVSGFFLGLVGWWLLMAAREEEQAGALHRVLDGVRMADLMRPVGAAPGWITIRTFAEQYGTARPGWVWLLERWGGGYEAVMAGDALRSVPPDEWDLRRPMELGVPVGNAVGAEPDDDALVTLSRTDGHQVVLVVAGGQTIGAVLPSDVETVLRSGRRPQPATGWPTQPASTPVG
jgi:hypothetical protein